jgi:hypothetical protein
VPAGFQGRLRSIEKDVLHLARPKLWQNFGNQIVGLTEGLCAVAHRVGCVFHIPTIAEHKENASAVLALSTARFD